MGPNLINCKRQSWVLVLAARRFGNFALLAHRYIRETLSMDVLTGRMIQLTSREYRLICFCKELQRFDMSNELALLIRGRTTRASDDRKYIKRSLSLVSSQSVRILHRTFQLSCKLYVCTLLIDSDSFWRFHGILDTTSATLVKASL